jgi:nucleotide-binding universal stress UspA family protein
MEMDSGDLLLVLPCTLNRVKYAEERISVFEKVLVPLDGSEVSELAVPYALDLGKGCKSKITFLQAVESLGQAIATLSPADPVMVTPETTEQIVEGVEAEQKAAEEYLNGMAGRFKEEGVEAGWVVLAGSAGFEILSYADREGFDTIVMATHGRTGFGRVLHGSVADHVLHHTKLPVLLVRPPAPESH